MGYPMTWSRFKNRNRLNLGDYNDAAAHPIGVNIDNPGGLSSLKELHTQLADHYVKRLKDYDQLIRLILGDLRRLESDMVDEKAICVEISNRTKIDADVVATVLKEFMLL